MTGALIHENEKAFLASALQRIIGALSAHSGSLFLLDHKNNELLLAAYHNSRGFMLADIKKKVGEGVSGAVIKIRKSILVKDIDTDPRLDRNGFNHYFGKSFISIPLFSDEHLVGLVNITDKTSGEAFTDKDLQFADNELKVIFKHWLEHRSFSDVEPMAEEPLPVPVQGRFLDITGQHPSMLKIFSMVEAVANTRATILINGESGTGKRLIAHAIHNCDPVERAKPFVEVSCGALTETLLESELFGHVKGAFTGAHKDRIGRFELADKGTIFLDEIDSFSLGMQARLLRVLQDGEFERVGDNKTVKVDVRIIVATNQDLTELITQGKFRKDLYYRLNIINIALPPLRERATDITALVHDLIKKHTRRSCRKVQGVSEDVLARFMAYDWPGNVRELENVLERAVILAKGPMITLGDLPEHLCTCGWNNRIENVISHSSAFMRTLKPGSGQGESKDTGTNLSFTLKDSEQKLILQALESAGGVRSKAAQDLGIDRTTLYKKMVNYGMLKVKKANDKKVLAFSTQR